MLSFLFLELWHFDGDCSVLRLNAPWLLSSAVGMLSRSRSVHAPPQWSELDAKDGLLGLVAGDEVVSVLATLRSLEGEERGKEGEWEALLLLLLLPSPAAFRGVRGAERHVAHSLAPAVLVQGIVGLLPPSPSLDATHCDDDDARLLLSVDQLCSGGARQGEECEATNARLPLSRVGRPSGRDQGVLLLARSTDGAALLSFSTCLACHPFAPCAVLRDSGARTEWNAGVGDGLDALPRMVLMRRRAGQALGLLKVQRNVTHQHAPTSHRDAPAA